MVSCKVLMISFAIYIVFVKQASVGSAPEEATTSSFRWASKAKDI